MGSNREKFNIAIAILEFIQQAPLTDKEKIRKTDNKIDIQKYG